MMARSLKVVLMVVTASLVAACGGRTEEPVDARASSDGSDPSTVAAPPDDAQGSDCSAEPPEATEIGVTADTITIEVMADVGASTAPGLFQSNHDALTAFADEVNANGGLACRQVEVRLWDTKLDADESLNGQIDACQNALAMVGSNALFNPNMTPTVSCPDRAGDESGLPDIAALANDINQRCNETTYLIQGVAETCETVTGEREATSFVGFTNYVLEQNDGDLRGLYMVPGDLPTTVQSATYLINAAEEAGVVWDSTLRISGRDEQAAFGPRVQQVRADGSNYVYNGANDRAMVAMRQESAAQGLDSVDVWACGQACYTRSFLETGGSEVEGTYVWMQFLPFEEADSNPGLQAYVDGVGIDAADSFGAQAYQAALLFEQVIDEIVATDGINGITRERMLEVLASTDDFNADGWMGDVGKDLRGFSDCQVILQVQDGEFARVFPEEEGTLHCDEANTVETTLDPAVEAETIE
jgi:ABC-type branched-subunit amino acid transport system substrate-binding protein